MYSRFISSLVLLAAASTAPAAYNGTLGGGHLSDSMLPAGVGALRLESRYGYADSRFTASGRRTSLADDLDGIVIDNSLIPVFPGTATPVPNGAVFGTTDMDIEVVGSTSGSSWPTGSPMTSRSGCCCRGPGSRHGSIFACCRATSRAAPLRPSTRSSHPRPLPTNRSAHKWCPGSRIP